MRYAIATYHIVSYPGIVCLSRTVAPGTKRGQRRYECVEFINGLRANDKSHVQCVAAMAPVALYSREGGAEERDEGCAQHEGHGKPKLEGNVFLRRVPTVCTATPRADKSLSRFYAHLCAAARPAGIAYAPSILFTP